jgi:hypothetical protein
LDTIGGDVPNRYGHFERAWKKNHGYDVKLSTDWFEDLLALPKARVSAAAHPLYRDCVLRSALLRAAVSSGRDPALARAVIELLLEFAYAHDGTFRDEVGRAIAAIGDEAVPALIAAGTVPPNVDEDGPEASRAAYARFNLDRMDRLHPSGAIAATRANPRLLAATLEAYGIAKPTEAAPSLVELVDDANLRVRKAARAALLEYLRGPAPTVARRNVRLLGGQTASARAYLSYRDRAIEALRTAVATVAPDVLLAECDLARPRHDCDEVVERQASAYLQWLDERRREQEREAIERALAAPDDDEALAAIDRLLARNPELEPEQALARFVTDAARRREASDEWQRAGQLYRKAAHLWSTLDPERARKIKLRALVAEMNVPELNDGGRSMLLMEAAELAPENAKLQRLARRSEHLDAGDEIPLQLLGAWALAMFGLGLLGPLTRPLRR